MTKKMFFSRKDLYELYYLQKQYDKCEAKMSYYFEYVVSSSNYTVLLTSSMSEVSEERKERSPSAHTILPLLLSVYPT